MKATYRVSGPLPHLPNIKSFTTSGQLTESLAILISRDFVAAWREAIAAQDFPKPAPGTVQPTPKTLTITIRL